jgi:predicted MFS family arabinose efflux permease
MTIKQPAVAPSWLIVAAAMAAYALSDVSAWLTPEIITGFMDEKSMSEAQAGSVSGLELISVFIASLLSSLFARHYPIRVGASLASIVCVISYLAIPHINSEILLYAARIASGLALGCLMTSSILAISTLKDAAVHYPKLYIADSLCGAALLAIIIPFHSALPEGTSIFTAIALLMLMIVPLALWKMPSRTTNFAAAEHELSILKAGFPNLSSYLLVIAVFLFGTMAGVSYSFAQVLGQNVQLGAEAVNQILSFSVLVSIPGSLMCIYVAKRFGQKIPALVVITIHALSNAILVTTGNEIIFLVCMALNLASVYFLFPFWQGVAMHFDISGGCAAAIGSAFAFSIAVGSFIGGWLIETFSSAYFAGFFLMVDVLTTVVFLFALSLSESAVFKSDESLLLK